MNNIRLTFLFLILSCALFSGPAFAQKPAKIISKADDAFEDENYTEALPLYLQVYPNASENQKVNANIGTIYITLGKPDKAVTYLAKAVKNAPKFNPDLTYSLSRAYQLTWAFDAAIEQYQALLANTPQKEEDKIALYNKHIKECLSGKTLKAKTPAAEVINLGPGFNSAASDHVPLLYNRDQAFILSSTRGQNPDSKIIKEEGFVARRKEENWALPQKMPVSTTFQEHDAITGIAANGKELYLYRDKNGGDIYRLKATGAETWSKPEPLPAPINSKAFESSFFVVKDNSYAFFSSDREGGFGGLDLYLTMKQPDGTWSEALNLGGNINTEYDEDAPFVSDDGTLYFSSRGHNSIGGYDIFKSTAQGAAWTIAQNVGVPVNTPFNDVYFVTEEGSHRAYFSSDRIGGLGDKDIYEAIFRSETATDSIAADVQPIIAVVPVDTVKPKAPEVPIAPPAPVIKTVIVTAAIFNETTKMPLVAQYAISQKSPAVLVTSAVSDSLTGTFTVDLEKAKAYTLLVQKEGYFYWAGEINIAEAYTADTLSKKIPLKKIETGAKIILNNIFFEYGKDVLSKSSLTELNRMAALLKENPTVKVEISGHTDDKGKPELNNQLSLKRAKAVVNYLVKKGVNASRLVAIGYGSRKPVASNRFEEGRKQNRRTEFKVLSQ